MKEADLFEYLKSNLYPDLVKSPGTYDTYDCSSAKAGHYIELKCRATHYDTLLVEEIKYRKLITQALENDLLPFYINSTPVGIYSFDLMDLPVPKWYSHIMPVSTEFENKDKIYKVCGYLDINEGVRI